MPKSKGKKSRTKIARMNEILECPITKDVMDEPVVLSCGHSFESSAIRRHLKEVSQLCPMCRSVVTSISAPSFAHIQMRSILKPDYQAKHGEYDPTTMEIEIILALSGFLLGCLVILLLSSAAMIKHSRPITEWVFYTVETLRGNLSQEDANELCRAAFS
jgi:hypothetical protein